jgi:hypothetical protein
MTVFFTSDTHSATPREFASTNQVTGLCDTGLFCSTDPRAIAIAPTLEAFGG